jgi:hypothetical protein
VLGSTGPFGHFGSLDPSGGGSGGAGFGSPAIIQGTNSVGATVNMYQFTTAFLNNTAGNERTTNDITTLLNGQSITQHLAQLNATGRQNATTAAGDHAPSVQWGSKHDLLVITLGDTVTSLIIGGLDLDADFQYEGMWMSANVIAGSGITVVRMNGDINGITGIQRYQKSGAAATMADTVASFMLDNPLAATAGFARFLMTGAPGLPKMFENNTLYQAVGAGQRWWENDAGITTNTVNVTSVSLVGNMNAGDVITMRCTRCIGG